MATQLATVEHLLGVPPRIGDTRLGLADSIESGLPVSALDHLADEVAPNDLRFKFRLIPKATLDRRKKSASRRLTSGEGDRLARIAKVFSFRSEEHTSELQSLMRISYAVFCLNKKTRENKHENQDISSQITKCT